MFNKLFGRKPKAAPGLTRSTREDREAEMVERYLELLDPFQQIYMKPAVLQWQDVKEFGTKEQQDEAVYALTAFFFGLNSFAASLLRAGSLETDFGENPEYVDFGVKVASAAAAKLHGEHVEKLLGVAFRRSQTPGHPYETLAYETGQREGRRVAQSIMEEVETIEATALRDVLKSINRGDQEAIR